MGAEWEMQELCGVGYEIARNAGESSSPHEKVHLHTSRHISHVKEEALSFSHSPPPYFQSGGVYIRWGGENDLNPLTDNLN